MSVLLTSQIDTNAMYLGGGKTSSDGERKLYSEVWNNESEGSWGGGGKWGQPGKRLRRIRLQMKETNRGRVLKNKTISEHV